MSEELKYFSFNQDTDWLKQDHVCLSKSLDSCEKETIWHRVIMDAYIPEETYIKFSYFANESKEVVLNGESINLDQLMMDKSISFQKKLEVLENFWIESILNPMDALLHKAKGRYLWYKLEFVGSEESFPFIKKMRIYFPMQSYLEYLPEIYREDKKSKDFLQRFLGIFQTMFLDMEEEIDHMHKYFDPDMVSKDFLEWLSMWVGIEDHYLWTRDQLKKLVKNAVNLYKKKGTQKGLEEVIELYTGEKPYIIEQFRVKKFMVDQYAKNLLENLYGDHPYMFTILVKSESVRTEKEYMTLKKIIEKYKPAYTQVNLVVLKPFIYMDQHTYLGVNTRLTQLMPLRLDNDSAIPFSTILLEE
ncbi:phage tail protein [Crassaminicella profunda]|uniref:phage tail protein n=1 Tax=Crassaminicella profunda TaxID=1286698 RepID=UPI001CA7918A|nr:phage tail protein [Crassaminicella profunda]QZY54469.1 hypothetical protein K7H06_15700 [Crassaminicella profunda]